jgi:hypothetical protein
MRSVYQRHLDKVSHYFASRPQDLLTINIEDEENPWQVLCKFLQVQIPETPFPHLRTPITGALRRCKPDEVETKRTAILKLLRENSIRATGAIPPMPTPEVSE